MNELGVLGHGTFGTKQKIQGNMCKGGGVGLSV